MAAIRRGSGLRGDADRARGEVAHLDPDAATLARVGKDPDAAGRLVRRHQPALTRFIARMLGRDDPEVDDVAQRTFIAALEAPSRFDGRASVRSWLFGIAHNQARMAARTRARRRRIHELFGGLQAMLPRAAAPPGEAAELASRLREALQQLDPGRRAVFLLTEAEGFTAREAAAVVGAPEGTVRRWRAEARQQLRPLLADLREDREAR